MSTPQPHRKQYWLLAVVVCCLMMVTSLAALAEDAATKPEFTPPDPEAWTVTLAKRGESDLDKLAPDLRVLYDQFAATDRSYDGPRYTEEQLEYLFGLSLDDRQPVVKVRIRLADGAEDTDLDIPGIA
ncbi:MAG: hypothetical protein ABIF77_09120, partial [bacterium]